MPPHRPIIGERVSNSSRFVKNKDSRPDCRRLYSSGIRSGLAMMSFAANSHGGDNELDGALLRELRVMANDGHDPIDLIHRMSIVLGFECPKRIAAISYLHGAFCIDLRELSAIAGWHEFGDGGCMQDDEINAILSTLIERNYGDWRSMVSG